MGAGIWIHSTDVPEVHPRFIKIRSNRIREVRRWRVLAEPEVGGIASLFMR